MLSQWWQCLRTDLVWAADKMQAMHVLACIACMYVPAAASCWRQAPIQERTVGHTDTVVIVGAPLNGPGLHQAARQACSNNEEE